MLDHDRTTTDFEAQRPRLRAVAYRMLGSTAEADDAVQEAWLRLSRADSGEIENLAGWLTTVVARVALDMLKARDRRREEYVGSWVPEPIVVTETQASDPEHEALLADSVGLALLVVLETLSPKERLAFVLHDMFAVSFAEIARIVDASPDAARQMASRARRRVRGAPMADGDLARQRQLVDAYLRAARDGDFDTLVSLLAPDAVMHHDSGTPNTPPLLGAQAIAGRAAVGGRSFVHLARPAIINGGPGIVVAIEERLLGVAGFTVSGGRIAEIDLITNPERLRQMAGRLL